ncbi:MAG: hypothetical protein J0M36_05015 [Caulobacterales bacterium]|nr:hypothetical protein [Caulobacterales bacterium]
MRPLVFVCSLLALSACDTQVESRREALQPRQGGSAPIQTAALTPAGAPLTLSPETDAGLQTAASVVELTTLEGQDAKIFGTAGGDPAMNGLYVHIAFFIDPAQGWRIFRIGDFLDYRVLRAAPGVVDLELTESVMDAATQQIGSQKRRIIVRWTPGEGGAAPSAVTVTPSA